MIEPLLAAAALGIAGFDPVGALILIAALTAGAHRREAAAFTITTFVLTVALGITLSLTIGPGVAEIDWSFLELTDGTWVALNVAIALVLGFWAVRRWQRSNQQPSETRRPRAVTVPALAGAGALFALTAAPDPSWLATIVLLGRVGDVSVVVLGHLVWMILSQLPLLLIFGAVLAGRHERAVAAFHRAWQRIRPRVHNALTLLIAGAAVFFVVDTGWYAATGHFLLG